MPSSPPSESGGRRETNGTSSKEEWRALLTAQTPEEARRAWHRWPNHADACDHAEGAVRASTMRRWRRQILGHGTQAQRWTNGLIEGLHTKIKQLKRVGDGFRNRDRYRRKRFLGFLPPTAIPPLLT